MRLDHGEYQMTVRHDARVGHQGPVRLSNTIAPTTLTGAGYNASSAPVIFFVVILPFGIYK